jgi:hypothetical protein
MSIRESIKEVFYPYRPELSEKKGVMTVELVVAERKSFLSKKKLTYIAKYRIDENNKEVRFTEMLKESGSGVSGGGDFDDGPGFGFKKETYSTGKGGREGSIQEQSDLFGRKYSYTFDFGKIRSAVEKRVVEGGYTFRYQITPVGL